MVKALARHPRRGTAASYGAGARYAAEADGSHVQFPHSQRCQSGVLGSERIFYFTRLASYHGPQLKVDTSGIRLRVPLPFELFQELTYLRAKLALKEIKLVDAVFLEPLNIQTHLISMD